MVFALEVVKCRGHLNQRLEESLFRFLGLQPHALPMFVCKEELLGPIAPQAFSKLSAIPIQ